ncbi:hypothetical protein OE88DRAFT_998957 [Heliocybe sulcata]|uniref:Uncharacterized protein n=1 Tax=Heliocybe sulcata TaxID=5364 RepID=A0A5C3NCQ1_9AGAM|nr:hypothetical protein OE88DRAFT_998957 [Heliocybe sulcata]
MLSGKQSSVSPNLSSSGLVRQTIRSSRGRKGPPGVKEKDVAALPPGSVLTLGSSRRGSPYQTEARQLMAESRAQTATVTVREMPRDRRSDSATDAVPTNNSISGRPTSQQTLPQADSAMLRRTSRAIQTIYMRPSEESSTSVTVNGTDTDARICRLEDEVRECRRENASSKQEARQAKEISRRCEEELFRLRGLLNGQSVAIRGAS